MHANIRQNIFLRNRFILNNNLFNFNKVSANLLPFQLTGRNPTFFRIKQLFFFVNLYKTKQIFFISGNYLNSLFRLFRAKGHYFIPRQVQYGDIGVFCFILRTPRNRSAVYILPVRAEICKIACSLNFFHFAAIQFGKIQLCPIFLRCKVKGII